MDFTADTGISPGRLDDGILEGCDFFGKCRLVLDCDSCGFSLAVGALITNVFLKNAVARIRPYDLYPVIELLVEKQTDFSFPSGHTCASFAAALVYLRMFPERKGWGFVILAVLIGFSRLYVGVHYPTDVLGGFFVGWLAGILALKAEAAWERHRKAERERV